MEQGLTDRVFCKNSSSQKETPKRLSLWNICGTVRQKSWSAKPPLWDFEACILFQKQVPSGRLSIFRYLTRLSLFYFSDVWSLSRLNSNVLQENFRLFDLSQVITLEVMCGSGFFLWRVQQMLLYWIVGVDLLILPCKMPKIPFLWRFWLPNPMETLATCTLAKHMFTVLTWLGVLQALRKLWYERNFWDL